MNNRMSGYLARRIPSPERPRTSGHQPLYVFQLGSLPPKAGGVSSHVERLCHLLHDKGHCVEVFEFINKREYNPNVPFLYHRGWVPWTMGRFFWRLHAKRPDLFHLHLSSCRSKARILPVMHLASTLSRMVLTIHSGSFPAEFTKASDFERQTLLSAFRHASAIIAVNESIRNVLCELGRMEPEMISVIPPFLPPPGIDLGREVSTAERRTPGRGAVVLATGYATPVYWWEGLAKAVDGLSEIAEVKIVFYCRYDEPYHTNVLRLFRSIKQPKTTILRDLDQKAFLHELAQSDVFVRPTLCDGDSLALREALALGKVAVASDAANRPPSCIIFEKGNPTALTAALKRAVFEQKTAPEFPDFASPLLELYGSVVAPGKAKPIIVT